MRLERETRSGGKPRPDWLVLWILFSAWCSASGWILSCFGCLDRAGYAASFLVFAVVLIIGRRRLFLSSARPLFLFRRTLYTRYLLPKLWAVLAVMALIGGLLYHPDNYDYLTYRFPRLLHWSWEHHWNWIATSNDRMNLSATGVEWLMAPLFIFFQTDRLFFLINWISYLFLPGLIFSVFRHLGISGRICWWWMWILPAGFCYAMQAGSMGNDMFAAVYFLGALHYLFKAGHGDAARNLALSVLALALLTGTKASNIPFGAPWLILVLLDWKRLWAGCHVGLLIGAGMIGALVSFLPVAFLNVHFSGDFTGDPTNIHRVKLTNPVAGVVGNSIEIAVNNFSPPVWPRRVALKVLPHEWEKRLEEAYPRLDSSVQPFQIEESAGLGLGVTVFAMLTFIYGLAARFGKPEWKGRVKRGVGWLALGTGIAWLGYMNKLGSEAAPRLVAPYYLLTIGSLAALLPLNGLVTHGRLWRAMAYLAMAMAFPLLLLNPSRPLIPPRWIVAGLDMAGAPASAVEQLDSNYALRASRFDGLRNLRLAIPESETAIGVVAGSDDPGVSLWLPFGFRKVGELIPAETTASQLEAAHIRFVAVSETMLGQDKMSLDDLLKKWSMKVILQEHLVFKVQRKTETWELIGPITSTP